MLNYLNFVVLVTMAIIFLDEGQTYDRIGQASNGVFLRFKRFLKQEGFFYKKARLAVLLIQHYQFLLALQLAFRSIPQNLISSPLAKLPYLKCLRDDINDICRCCPWVQTCDATQCKLTECLGKACAYFLIEAFYQTQQRKLDCYVGADISRSKRFFVLQNKNQHGQRERFITSINAMSFTSIEQGEIVIACKQTLSRYTSDLQVALQNGLS